MKAIRKENAVRNEVEDYITGLLVEETGEALKFLGSTGRFGIDTHVDDEGNTPREQIEKELGDILAAVDFAHMHGYVSREVVQEARRKKLAKLLDPRNLDNMGRPLAPRPPENPDRDVAWLRADAAEILARSERLGLVRRRTSLWSFLSGLIGRRDEFDAVASIGR